MNPLVVLCRGKSEFRCRPVRVFQLRDWKAGMILPIGPWVAAFGISLLLGMALVWPLAAAGHAGTITTATLLEEMTDLQGLVQFPSPAYTCRQFSSYDQASKSPEENWFANDDRGQHLRVEERDGRKEYVMMDTAGPGAIVRIWSANPSGTLRIYLDHGERPVLEAAATELLGGDHAGLPRPIAGMRARGWNLYFPIPYARHCKVTVDSGDLYYHVNYRTYEPGTVVETFQLDQLRFLDDRIRRVASHLENAREVGQSYPGRTEEFSLILAPGGVEQVALRGPASIRRVAVRLSAVNRDTALRGVVVRGEFDGEQTVEVPLGDFFGTAPGINAYEGLPLGMTRWGEMYSHWHMPFRETAMIELFNYTLEEVALTGQLTLAPHAWTDDSMHFHAKWRSDLNVPTRPMQDWNYMEAQGRGVFVGAAFSIDNPVRDWWGEGDEKIYVDGETFPSHFGTGTEDYFGYAWCSPELFSHAYHAQPRCDGPGNYGRTSVNRWHILDRIPFSKSFRFDMELWHWHGDCRVNLAVVTYWYARPGATDNFARVQPSDVLVQPMPVHLVPRVPGAIEGELLRILHVQGTTSIQDWDGLSGGKHLWWHEGIEPGHRLRVSFEAPRDGRYRVMGHFLSARDYGVHQLAINDHDAGDPIDFYNPEVRPTGERDLGIFELRSTNNALTVTVLGAHPSAVPSYMFGLDYLRLLLVE
jgi:hypothetical protein